MRIGWSCFIVVDMIVLCFGSFFLSLVLMCFSSKIVLLMMMLVNVSNLNVVMKLNG